MDAQARRAHRLGLPKLLGGTYGRMDRVEMDLMKLDAIRRHDQAQSKWYEPLLELGYRVGKWAAR
jgi:hypothetical protein